MTLLHTIILGIVEGITEFLPISSTGHLIIAEHLFGIPSTDAVKSFSIIIQLGAICAALLVYWKTLIHSKRTMLLVLAAFVPTAILGALLHGIVKQYLLGDASIVAWSLSLGGIVIIVFEMLHKDESASTHDLESMSFLQAMTIGILQTLAIVPGVSRSAATILGGMSMGIRRTVIVDFSFLLAIPTMAGATALDLFKSYDVLTQSDVSMIAVGFVIAFVSAYMAIKWLLAFVRTHTFISFGIYRILAAGALWMFVL